MNSICDLIVIGAGPAGLMAAKTAAQKGLKVTVIELKKDITKVKRACSSQFVTDAGYENETIKFEDNQILFTKNNFKLNYTGPLLNIIDNYHYSPSWHRLHLYHKDHRPFSIKFDKSHLLKDLLNECEKLGVTIMPHTVAYGGQDLGRYVIVDIKRNNKPSSLFAKKLIIAEGANAKLTGIFGFNKNRRFYGKPFVFSCIMDNTVGFEPQSWNQFYGKKLHPFAEVIIESALEGNNAVEITITGTKEIRPDILFEKFIKSSPLSSHFTHAYIIEKRGCSVKSYDSILKPYDKNVLVIGDSAAHIEVIVQGAIMCGFHAGNAVYDELNDKNGFIKYATWWKNTFDFNRTTPENFLKLYGALNMMPKYTDDELDYIFSLAENDRICGNFSQFEVPKNVWKAILKHKDRIKKEMPDLFSKIEPITKLHL